MDAVPSLTRQVQEICRTLVRDHLPGELQLFDPIWSAVWTCLPEDSIEALRGSFAWNRDGQARTVLSAMGHASHQAIDTLNVVGAIIGAAVSLLNKPKDTLIETTHVQIAIRDEAARLQVSAHVRQVLESFATGLLAEQFSAIDWHGQRSCTEQSPSGLLLVESCDPDAKPPVMSGLRSRAEVESDFRPYSTKYALYVDEPESLILADGNRIPWKNLQARHLHFLYVTLKALRHGSDCVLSYDELKRHSARYRDVDDNSIRRVKSKLNSILGGVINRILTAQPGMRCYTVVTTPYCWIRLDGADSRLCPDAQTTGTPSSLRM